MSKELSRSALRAGTIAFALALAAGPALAQDKPVELKFAHWLPAAHPLAKLGFEPWAKSVEAGLKGSIKVHLLSRAATGQGPNHYDMARDGIADITWINPGYQAERFRDIRVGEQPFLFANARPDRRRSTPGTAAAMRRRR